MPVSDDLVRELRRVSAWLKSVSDRFMFPDNVERDAANIEIAAARIEHLQSENARLEQRVGELADAIPDDIEVLRMLKLGGRSRADQARVIASKLERIEQALRTLAKDSSDG